LPSPRWRPVAAGSVVAAVTSTVGWALLDPAKSDVTTHPPGYRSPAPVWGGAPVLQAVGAVIGVAAAIGGGAAGVVRGRRATGAARELMAWLLYGGVLTLVLLAAAFAAGGGGWLLALSAVPLPLAIVAAVLRQGMWDIHVVIDRSLVYGTLSVGVA